MAYYPRFGLALPAGLLVTVNVPMLTAPADVPGRALVIASGGDAVSPFTTPDAVPEWIPLATRAPTDA